jgi:cobaltochelatase CobN
VDEELLHANTSVPPPHQFLAFYHWIRDVFRADAVVHLGRHSTYEFLPGKAVGLTADDYPSLVAADLPGIYPYIVDGVGEGIQAKRRGLAVIVDHLTPPLSATPLYDKLLELRQVVESFEAAGSDSLKTQAARRMREQVTALNLRAELEASMADVLEVRGIGFEDADDDLLAHEIGHYLTKLQEKFMPHGLHIFGQDWSAESLKLMADSMGQVAGGYDAAIADKLAASPRLEMEGLLAGLDGRFVAPGKGNDPLRSPEALPTGRNFHAVDGDLLPTRLGYALGARLAEQATARPRKTRADADSDAVILWASDAVRDEGAMVAFCLSLLGAEPVWNARGIVTDVRLLADTPRRDVIVTTSGLFRDLYPNLLNQIDRAGRLALAASAGLIAEQHPELGTALDAALAPLGGNAARGHQPLADNIAAARWPGPHQASSARPVWASPTPGAPRPCASSVMPRAPTVPASIAWPNVRAPGKSAANWAGSTSTAWATPTASTPAAMPPTRPSRRPFPAWPAATTAAPATCTACSTTTTPSITWAACRWASRPSPGAGRKA